MSFNSVGSVAHRIISFLPCMFAFYLYQRQRLMTRRSDGQYRDASVLRRLQ